jgi:pimeloyl-ACP methyl ester carboxylesterase
VPVVTDIRERRVRTNGIELVVSEAGRRGDPVVVLSHGFPECAHSWRHQMAPLAEAGFHVLAPDQRGYGHSSRPEAVSAYHADELSADLLGLLDDVGTHDAVFVGHDWGALLVWHMARIHPERMRAVVGVSVPYTPWPAVPTELMKAMSGDRFFYMLYFQQVGPPERELEADVRRTMHTILWSGSGEMYRGVPAESPPMDGTGFLDAITNAVGPVPEGLPAWLTEHDLDVYVERFEASGFFGPVSWYRNIDADHERVKDVPHTVISMPTAFIGGTKDAVIAGRPGYVEAMSGLLPDYRGATLIEGAGHWTQQEAPEEFNDALLEFMRAL